MAEPLARVGFATKGIVYLMIGLLAAGVAFHLGGQTTNSQGVMHTLLRQPLGRTLLGVLTAGLAAYSLWNFYTAALDADHQGSSFKGIINRIGNFFTGIGYGLLAAQAILLLLGHRMSGHTTETWTRRGLSTSHGIWLVGAVGVGIVIYAIVRLRAAFVSDVGHELGLGELERNEHRLVIGLGRFGIAAQAVVASIIGAFVLKAALSYDPDQVGGMSDALTALRHNPYSPFVLGTVGLGIAANGCYELLKARYRVTPPAWPSRHRAGCGAGEPPPARRA